MYKIIGTRVPPIDGKERVTGRAQFVTDMQVPGMLWGKILHSPYPHARILNIDTSQAKKVSGVKAVLTFEDTPQVIFGPLIEDWHLLAKDKVRFVGEEIAAVAAIDADAAEEAISLIKVEYELLPAVFDPEEAMQDGAPIINTGCERNIASTFKVERGDVETAKLQSDFILEQKFYTNQVYQAYLEPMACLAYPDVGGQLVMYLPIQIPGRARFTYAKGLGMLPEDIRIIKPYVGGAFGAKMEIVQHAICGLLARKTGKPVKMVYTRHEDFIAANPRVPMHIYLKIGFKKDGEITFKETRVVAGSGGRTSHAPAIMSTACYRMDSTYKFKNIRTMGYNVYTNTVPTGCFRGFGNSQMTFAIESALDMAAVELKIDPAELRLKNAYHSGEVSIHGWKLNTVGLSDCIAKVCQAAGWSSKKYNNNTQNRVKRGIGLACTNHVSGNRNFFPYFDGSSVICRIAEDGKVTLFHGESDIGQGQDTAYAIIAAEELGVKLEDVRVAKVDTQICGFGMGSFSTRGTLMGGNATRLAAVEAKAKILEVAAKKLEVSPDELEIADSVIYVKGDRSKCMSFANASRQYVYTHGGMSIIGYGTFIPDTELPDPETKYGNVSPAYPYAAQIAEVEVDTDTGEVKLINYWACHDVGQVINLLMLEGQVEGGVVMGAGWALMENMVTKDGYILNDNFLDYRVPGPQDIPKINSLFVETNDPNGPFGAKGIGEPVLNPVPAAIANAIYNAIGIRFTELPITAEKVLKALKGKK